jgi:hypothetical protein
MRLKWQVKVMDMFEIETLNMKVANNSPKHIFSPKDVISRIANELLKTYFRPYIQVSSRRSVEQTPSLVHTNIQKYTYK